MRILLTVIAVTFALLAGVNATAQQSLTIEKAQVNLKTQSLHYQASVTGFSITGPGDYRVFPGLTNVDNGETTLQEVSLTEFNDDHLEGGGNFGDCPAFTDIKVKKASLNIDDENILKIKAKLCNYSCDANIGNFVAILALVNTFNGEFVFAELEPTKLLPKKCP